MQLPIGSEHDLTGIVDLLNRVHEPGGAREGDPVRSRRSSPTSPRVPREAARRGRRDRRGADGALPRRRGARPGRGRAALKTAVTNDELFPVACGVANPKPRHAPRCSTCSSRACRRRRASRRPSTPAADGRVRLQDDGRSRSRAGSTCFRVLAGTSAPDSNARATSRPREGAVRPAADAAGQGAREGRRPFGAGDIGAVAKLKDVQTGDVLADAEHDVELAAARASPSR